MKWGNHASNRVSFRTFNSGLMPYSGLGGMEVVDFLKSGQRLKQPDGCPDKMYFFSNFFSFMLIKDLSCFLTRATKKLFLASTDVR